MPVSSQRPRSTTLRRMSMCGLGLLALTLPRPVQATDCNAAESPCVPASPLWLRAGHSRWQSLPSPKLGHPGALSVNLTSEYTYKPLLLEAPSPDPEGREIRLVHHRVGTTVGVRFSPLDRAEVGMSLPFVLYQTGSGTAAVTDRSADPIPSTALADPRLEGRYRLAETDHGGVDAGALILIPLGDRTAHAGEPSFVVAPEVIWGGRFGRFGLSGGLGFRLRKAVNLGNATYGSQFALQLAIDCELVERWLSLTAEAQLLSGLRPREVQVDAETRTSHLERPAEWLAGVRSEPVEHLQLGVLAGTALPLGSETTRNGSESFASLGAPRFHGLLDVRYAFE